ncbi:MAG: glycoside hydrolase family 3 protein [Acidobacteriota bacterium]|nr:glycoside hydrolase family 3 protein [Acidobacteriota bacterium]
MRAKLVTLATTVVATTLALSGAAASTSTTTLASSPTTLACATQTVSTWSTAKQANEVVAVSINAANVGALGPAARAGFGGVLLFGATAPQSLPSILATLQRERGDHVTTLFMTDAEGGGVLRLSNVLASIPWAQTMGKNLTNAAIQAEGARLGASMLAQGLNVDLAPVADLDARAVYPDARDADGYRAFGGDPTQVAEHVVAFERGLESAGVLGTLKHFPGLGGASWNTDYGPAHTLSWATLRSTALVPYRAALARTSAMVMVSNASVPGLTSLPASIAAPVTAYLRDVLDYRGLIMTDSLSAGALSARHLSVAQASVDALVAGADLVLAGNPTSPSAALAQANATARAIARAVAAKTLPAATLAAAASQVVAARSSLACAP